MVDITTRIINQDNDKTMTAEIFLYNEEGDKIESIQITNETEFNQLVERLNELDEKYVENEELETILTNINNQKSINATTLNNLQSDKFAKADVVSQHINTNASENTYGHVKTINNVTSPAHVAGEALSAYQGKLLQDLITNLTNGLTTWTQVYYGNNLNVYYNQLLRVCYFTYKRTDYTGFSSSAGQHFAGKADLAEYLPKTIVTKSFRRADISFSLDTSGNVNLHSLNKFSSVDLYCNGFYRI